MHTTVTASTLNSIQPHGITAVRDGFWVTGTVGTASDQLDFMVAKFNDSGRLLFLKRLGTAGDETSYPVGIAPTAAGGCVIGGRSHEPSVDAGLAAIGYFNSDGTLKWWRKTTSNNNSGRYDAFRNVLVTKDGNVFGCGSSHQWNYNSQLLLAALDSNGKEIFRNSYRYSAQTHMGASAEFGSGYVVGGHDGKSPVVLTVTATGVVSNCFGYNSADFCPISSLVVSPSGKIYVTGGYMAGGKYELWVACIKASNGSLLWQKRYGLGFGFGGKIEWVNNRLLVSFAHNTDGVNWYNGFAQIDSMGNAENVKLIRFKNNSFENHLSGINSARLQNGGMAFVGTNKFKGANFSLSLLNPCDTLLCSIINTRFSAVNNTGVTLTGNKGTMYYDGNFATNLVPNLSEVKFTQIADCAACSLPLPTAFRDTQICSGQSVTYRIADNKTSVRWSDADTSHIKKIIKSGIYNVVISNSCGVYRDTFEVKNYPDIVGNLPHKITICPGDSFTIDASQPINKNYQYSWNDGSKNARKVINKTGLFILTTTDQCSSRKDTLIVNSKSAGPPIRLKDTFLCDTPFSFKQIIKNYSFRVAWFDGDTSHTKQFAKSGIYVLNYSDSCGNYSDTFEIVLQSAPVKVLDTVFKGCSGGVLNLNGKQTGKGNYSYLWSNGAAGPQISVKNSGIITLHTSNSCGKRTDTARIAMADCFCDVCIPSAFTPGNRDGLNDVFRPRLDCHDNKCTLKESYMRIYNRWGEKLYDAPATEGWDGTYLGEKVPEGQYVYVLYMLFDDYISGKKIRQESGLVTVLYPR